MAVCENQCSKFSKTNLHLCTFAINIEFKFCICNIWTAKLMEKEYGGAAVGGWSDREAKLEKFSPREIHNFMLYFGVVITDETYFDRRGRAGHSGAAAGLPPGCRI